MPRVCPGASKAQGNALDAARSEAVKKWQDAQPRRRRCRVHAPILVPVFQRPSPRESLTQTKLFSRIEVMNAVLEPAKIHPMRVQC